MPINTVNVYNKTVSVSSQKDNSNKCFRIVDFNDTLNEGVTWDTALALCQGDQPGIASTLASVQSLLENGQLYFITIFSVTI